MYQTGVYFGRFLPPHRGHLYQMIEASTRCEKLVVVISDNRLQTEQICREAGMPLVTYQLRKQWICQQVQDMPHIQVRVLDETDIPAAPKGWAEWAERMRQVVPEHIDAFFVGDRDYDSTLATYFADSKIELFEPARTRYPISATEIRADLLNNWHYILGPARPFFARKVLIAGTESTGKTTLTKCLAKLYNTSWSEEVGRYYAHQYLGGDESIYTDGDFSRMAYLQAEQDYQAMRNANKVCFFDTDAVVTDYYSELYMGHRNKMVEAFIAPDKYDVVLFLTPDVRWVADGQRLNGDQERREQLSSRLMDMYQEFGFGDKLVFIRGDYNARLSGAIRAVDELLKLKVK